MQNRGLTLTATINHVSLSFSAVQIYDVSSFHLFSYFDKMIVSKSRVFIKFIRHAFPVALALNVSKDYCNNFVPLIRFLYDVFNPDEEIALPYFVFHCFSSHRQLD